MAQNLNLSPLLPTGVTGLGYQTLLSEPKGQTGADCAMYKILHNPKQYCSNQKKPYYITIPYV